MTDNKTFNALLAPFKEHYDSLVQSNDTLNTKIALLEDSIADLKAHIADLEANAIPGGSSSGISWWWIPAIIVVALLLFLLLKKKLFSTKIHNKNTMSDQKIQDVNYDEDFSASSKAVTSWTESSVPCIAAVASDTRKEKNQDSFCEAYVEKAKARIIAVADGVGSSYKSEEGSKIVAATAVDLVKKAIESKGDVDFDSVFQKIQIDFDGIFDKTQEELDAKVETDYPDELALLKPASFGSTLIIGIDMPDRFIAAYVGNGSIWHVSGLFNTFPSIVSLPWNAVNLMTPDTIMSGGKEALYKIFFYKGEKKRHHPTVLQLSKLNEAPGDMFIITTDGVYSSDHAIAAKDEEGETWIPSTSQFGLLCDYLKAYVEGPDDINDETLKQMLVKYLSHIKEAKIMDDDTTLGVFISDEAKKHFLEKRNNG